MLSGIAAPLTPPPGPLHVAVVTSSDLLLTLLVLATVGACAPPAGTAAPGPSPQTSGRDAAGSSGTPAPPADGAKAGTSLATAAASVSATGTPVAAVSSPADKPASLLQLDDVAQVVKEAVHSLALDPERGKVAALGQQPWLDDGKGWKPIPLPAELEPKDGERDEARIHFGRDYQPRIMGTRHGPAGPRQHYLRYRLGSWRLERRELAAFAGKPHAAIYGVLGWDDPEVLCKVGAFCLIKQRSGWSQVPLPVAAPATALRIDLGADAAYALLERRLLRLGPKSWISVGTEGPWKGTPGGAWISPGGGWVSAPEEDALYRHTDRQWTRHRSPVRRPRGLWAGRDDELWIAGSDGVGHFDGTQWWRIDGVAGPTSEVIGRGERLWFGGGGGVWSATRRSR